MSFGTKKKKRSWRDAEETDGPAAATAEEGGADSEEDTTGSTLRSLLVRAFVCLCVCAWQCV